MADQNEETGTGGLLSQDALDALMAQASAQMNGEDEEGLADMAEGEDADLGSAMGGVPGMGHIDLAELSAPSASPGVSNSLDAGFSRVRDIPLDVTVELGRTRMLIRDILDLSTGSIIELEKIAGEPVDLLANGLLVARGEVVVIDDNFGVRVTEIITAAERGANKDARAA